MMSDKDDPVLRILGQIERWEVSGPHHASELAGKAIAIQKQNAKVIEKLRAYDEFAYFQERKELSEALAALDSLLSGEKV